MADTPETEKKETLREQVTHPFMTMLQLVTYPVAAVAAYLVGRTEIRKALYKNFVTSGAFKDIQPTHRNELSGIIEKAAAGHVIDGPALAQESNNAYRLLVKEKFEKAGFHTVMDYWKGLHTNQKASAILFAAGAAGIVITTSMAIVNNKELLERLNLREKEREGAKEAMRLSA